MPLGRKYLRGYEDGFEWRGREVSRLEGLSDAVFGFAITLLVVSLEVPRTSAELLHAMRGFVGFAVSFFLLFRLWAYQYRFFRRYGLEDPTTIRLNAVLLFVVLFFIYPLKFITSAITNWVLDQGVGSFRPGVLTAALAGNGYLLLLIFYAGFGTVFLMLGLMYYHAYRLRDEIGLNELEALDTRITFQRLLLPLPVFPPAVGLLWLPTLIDRNRATVKAHPRIVIVSMLLFEALIIAYLVWSFRVVGRLKKRRRTVAEAMTAGATPAPLPAVPVVEGEETPAAP